MMNAMITKMIKKWEKTYFKDFQCVAGSVLHNSTCFLCNSCSERSPVAIRICSAVIHNELMPGWCNVVVLLDIHIVFGLWMPAPRIEIEAYPEVFVGYNG